MATVSDFERCPAAMMPPHFGAQLVRCRYSAGEHGLHYGVDHEPPRTIRKWLDSSGAAIVDSHGGRVRGEA